MSNWTRDFFIYLSQNKFLNESAKKWGFRLGAEKFVAGTTIREVVPVIKKLNEKGIHVTLDHLGEFVNDKKEATLAKEKVLEMLDVMHNENLDSHLSVKLTQLGLDIDFDFCLENMKEIVERAKEYGIFVNIDMEDYSHLEDTFNILFELRKESDLVGTVVQSYLYRTADDMEQLKDVRLRIVKGAYKENDDVAYQSKKEIDANFLKLAKQRLLDGKAFTSIATHDHHIINELKQFVEENNIKKDTFEFQMLYGFRQEMQYALKEEGYAFCTYIPFGQDWFGYYMRRLAERPQNLQLIWKDMLYDDKGKVKRKPVAVLAIMSIGLLYLSRKKKWEKAS